jgi:hypothetical protein
MSLSSHIAPFVRLQTVMTVVLAFGIVFIGWGQTAGPNNAGTGENITGVGTIAWTGPANITTINSPYASVTVPTNDPDLITNYLQGTNYGFSIPSNVTVLGITVTINRYSPTGTNRIRDYRVMLVKGGVIQTGTNYAATSTNWPTSIATATYGGISDLWGNTWTPADINASNFGVAVSVTNPAAADRTGYVDYIQVTVTYATPCGYADATSSGITHTPCINISANVQTVSTTIDPDYYFVMNVIKGLTYQVYTCESTNPANPLKMTVYEEGNPSGPILAFSASNTGNTCATGANNVFLSFTSSLSGQVRILINRATDCSSTNPADLDLRVNVSAGPNTQDNQANAATDTWIGHIYDATNSVVAYDGSFSNYLGYYTQSETFNETFGGGGNDTYCFGPVTSNGTNRASVLTVSYSVRYRMNSTKEGLYSINIGSDDGSRLTVDESLIYSDWVDQGYAVNSNILMDLTGSSSLLLDFYENAGGNQISFQSLTLILANSLNTNTSQTICLGNSGAAISGDTYGTLPSGISLSGTGYQWAYGSSSTGPWTDISGATGATYTPNTSTAPLNTAGVYYIVRKAKLSSTNNVSPNPYVAINESNSATLTVLSPSTAPTSITGTSSICAGSSTTLTTNGGSLGTEAEDIWYTGACPAEAFTQEWTTQPYSTYQTTVNSVTGGVLNVTSTGNDPMIFMDALGSFNPNTYRYVQIRYKVTVGTGGYAEIFFYNTTHNYAVTGEEVAGALLSDGNWHILNLDMWTDPEYTTGGNITGWRFDWSSNSGTTMDIDFITLADQPILDIGTSVTVIPGASTTYYTLKKGACNTTGCASLLVTVHPIPTFTTAVKNNVSCYGGSDGRIDVTITGGVDNSPYYFSINNGSDGYNHTYTGDYPTYTLTGLPEGTHKIRVMDKYGCISENCP